MSCEATGIDFAYCLLKASATKKKRKVGNKKLTCQHGMHGDAIYGTEQVVPLLLKYFPDVNEYAKAHSLNDPKVPLIKLLLKLLAPKDIIPLFCQIRHFDIAVNGVVRKGKRCCSLHWLITKCIPESILDALIDIDDVKIIGDFLSLYGRCIKSLTEINLLHRLDETGCLSERIIKAIMTKKFRKRYDDTPMIHSLILSLLDRLQHRPELFVVAYERLPNCMDPPDKELDSRYSGIGAKWKWYIYAEKTRAYKDSFVDQTIRLQNGYIPRNVRPHEYYTFHYYRAYLKNVVSLPKRFWSQAMKTLAYPFGSCTAKFNLKEGQLLYESKEARRVLKVLLKRGNIPYIQFDREYHEFGAKTGIFKQFKYNPKISDQKQLIIFSKLYDDFKSFDHLNTITKGCLKQVFLPKMMGRVKEVAARHLTHFCNLPVDALSMEDWRRFHSHSHCYHEIFRKRPMAESKQLLEGIGMMKNATESTLKNIWWIYDESTYCHAWEKSSMESLLREVFNPDIISVEFRSNLLLFNDLSRFNMKLNLDVTNGGQFGIKHMQKAENDIEKLIKCGGKDDNFKWKCLLQAPPSALIRSHAFWKYLSSDFFEDLHDWSNLPKLLKAFEEQEGKSALILLHTIMNTYFDSIRLLFNNEYDVNYNYFWTKVYSSTP